MHLTFWKTLPAAVIAVALLHPLDVHAEDRWCVMDMARALRDVPDGKAATARLKSKLAASQKQLDDTQAQLKQRQAALDKEKGSLSKEVVAYRTQEWQEEVQRLQVMYQTMQSELDADEKSAANQITARLKSTAREVAASKGCAPLLNTGNDVVYRGTDLPDITDAVVQAYSKLPPLALAGSASTSQKPGDTTARSPATATTTPAAAESVQVTSSSPAAPQRPVKPLSVFALPLHATRIPADLTGLASRVLLAKLAEDPRLHVLSDSEINSMLSVQKKKDLLSCTDSECLAEIGGALGTDLLLAGDIGKMGKRYTILLQVIQFRTKQMCATTSDWLDADEDALASQLPVTAAALADRMVAMCSAH